MAKRHWGLVLVTLLGLHAFGDGSAAFSQSLPPGTITGIVTDENGRPTESVVVAAAPSAEATDIVADSMWIYQQRGRTGTTDASGRYIIGDLSAGSYVAVVAVAHRTDPQPHPDTGGCTARPPGPLVDFRFFEAVEASRIGALIDPSRKAAQWIASGLVAPAADATRFVYRTTFSPSTTSPATAARVTVDSGGTASANIRLRLSPSARIAGRVTGARTIFRLLLTLSAPDLRATTVTQPDGTFIFMGVPTGSYTLEAWPTILSCDLVTAPVPHWRSGRSWFLTGDADEVVVDLQPPTGNAGTLTVAVPPRRTAATQPDSAGGSIVGRVTSISGRGVPRVRLMIRDEQGAAATIVSDDEGRYAFTNVAPGTYQLAAAREGWEPTMYGQLRWLGEGTRIRITQGSRFEANIQMKRHGSVSGTVTDELGQPAARVSVWAPHAYASTDRQGRYELRGVREGRWPVVVLTPFDYRSPDPYARDPLPTPNRQVEVVGGERTDGVDFRVNRSVPEPMSTTPAMRLDARIEANPLFDGAGAPPSSVQIGAVAVTGEHPWRTTNGFGTPISGPLPSGHYILRATAPYSGWVARSAIVDGIDMLDQPISLENGQRKQAVVTFTTGLTRLSGTVRASDGTPMARITLLAFSANSADWNGQSRRIRMVRPRSDGFYEIDGLPAGGYKMMAVVDLSEEQRADDEFFQRIQAVAVPVELQEGAPVSLDIAAAALSPPR